MFTFELLSVFSVIVAAAYCQDREPAKNPPPYLAVDLELPKEEPASVPFYTESDYATIPVPSEELQAPSAGSWNPDNDPNLYYEHDAVLATNLYPKKYQQERKSKTPKKVDEYILERSSQSGKVHADAKDSQISSSLNHLHADNAAAFILAKPNHRSEFRMHGYDGPKSYKWGYDTGKGPSRQFRYEQRDNSGYVKGHYGYYDKNGKLRMVRYDSHPQDGFHVSTDR